MTDLKLNLSWDTYQKTICNGLGMLQQRGEFVDMTIAADGHFVKVHKMVLSLVSPYIKEIVSSMADSHPVIFLNKVSSKTLVSILEYAYTGEVLVSKYELNEFIEACKALRIKGLENEHIQKNTSSGSRGRTNEATNTEETFAPHTEKKNVNLPYVANVDRLLIEDQPMDTHTDFVDRTDDETDYEIVPEQQANPPEANETSIEASKSSLQYSLSCQGSVQLVLNRYIYRLRHARQNHEIMWRCADYVRKRCDAFAFTKGDFVTQRVCAHNHPYHDAQILKRVKQGNMYTAFNSAAAVSSAKKLKKNEMS